MNKVTTLLSLLNPKKPRAADEETEKKQLKLFRHVKRMPRKIPEAGTTKRKTTVKMCHDDVRKEVNYC